MMVGLIQIPLPVISQGSKYEVWHGRRLLAALDSQGPGPGRSVWQAVCGELTNIFLCFGTS